MFVPNFHKSKTLLQHAVRGSTFNTLTQQRQRNDIIAESHSIPASYYFFIYIPLEEFHLGFLQN
jgi:hypothetical protein